MNNYLPLQLCLIVISTLFGCQDSHKGQPIRLLVDDDLKTYSLTSE